MPFPLHGAVSLTAGAGRRAQRRHHQLVRRGMRQRLQFRKGLAVSLQDRAGSNPQGDAFRSSSRTARPECEQIRSRARRLTEHLLGRHVLDRAYHRTRGRQRRQRTPSLIVPPATAADPPLPSCPPRSTSPGPSAFNLTTLSSARCFPLQVAMPQSGR